MKCMKLIKKMNNNKNLKEKGQNQFNSVLKINGTTELRRINDTKIVNFIKILFFYFSTQP